MHPAPAPAAGRPPATSARRAAALKLCGLLLLGAVVLSISELAALGALLGGVLLAAVLGGVRLAELWRQARVVLPLLGAVVLAHGLLSGWEHGAVVAARILVLVAAAATVTLSTRTADLLAVATAACRPLRPLGVDPAKVGLVLAMTMRFLPLIADRLAAIREAQRARGIERPGLSTLVPLLVGTLRLADDLADALDARGAADAPPQPPGRRGS